MEGGEGGRGFGRGKFKTAERAKATDKDRCDFGDFRGELDSSVE